MLAIQWGYKNIHTVTTVNNNAYNLTTKFRGLEPTNPQGKTSKQLIQKSFRGKNPTNNCIATKNYCHY